MKLYLIRHAETVDNVAGLWAGVRDSKLTLHGAEQATRLGQYFARNCVKFTHIFSSPLERTVKTSEAILNAQNGGASDDGGVSDLTIVKCPELIEQNFGYYEGKPFRLRSKAGQRIHGVDSERRKADSAFVDVESKESMGKRADEFLDRYLLPLFKSGFPDTSTNIAIVSHGMLLSTLWRRILSRLPQKSISIVPEVTAGRGAVVLEHLGGWSNTGYLELLIKTNLENNLRYANIGANGITIAERPNVEKPDPTASLSSSKGALELDQEVLGKVYKTLNNSFNDWSTTILAIDSRMHLIGLKRQRGGIGSLAHDESQKKLDNFFVKRQRRDL